MQKTHSQKHPVYIVGAGPGDIELITVKGLRLINEADCIVYAGSLVNKDILRNSNAEIFNSAGLYLEQIIDIMTRFFQEGKKVVRLHTGDPSLFGAIQEQMAALDKEGIPYEIIPGVSSAFGTAASLKTELTLPEISQTVIITRIEGRTPVPEKEKLYKLASHQATMMIFLSVSMIDKVTDELKKGGYPGSTAVVVVEKATWPTEKVVRGTIDTISGLVTNEEIKKTAMICVGEVFAISDPEHLSKLYDKNFSHGTRS